MKQAEIIKRLTDSELKKQLILSQLLFLCISLIASLFLFENLLEWLSLFSFKPWVILIYGVFPAIGLVIIEIILYKILPKRVFDDGGINERIFKNQPIPWIAFISLLVAICEEMLFRGVIQVTFGYVFASSLFAIIHVRYIKKPILFVLILVVSFLIGYLFLQTNNVLVTIVFHFIVDFLLGMYIRNKR